VLCDLNCKLTIRQLHHFGCWQQYIPTYVLMFFCLLWYTMLSSASSVICDRYRKQNGWLLEQRWFDVISQTTISFSLQCTVAMMWAFLCIRHVRMVDAGIISQHYPFICTFVYLLRKLWTRYFENQWTDFDVICHNWFAWRWRGHVVPEVDSFMKRSTSGVRSSWLKGRRGRWFEALEDHLRLPRHHSRFSNSAVKQA